MSLRAAALDDPQAIRHAGRDLLSLALIDARNLGLRWLEVFERRGQDGNAGGGPSARQLVAHAGWYQEYWIARNVQRGRGERADASAPRLASIEPAADGWFAGPAAEAPAADDLRRYLAETLDVTLDLLAGARSDSRDSRDGGDGHDGDDALFFFRQALLHEDRINETLAERAAALQLRRQGEPPPPWQPPPARNEREPLWLPAARLALGSRPGGLVPDNERWAEELAVPEFEIDTQPVSWARYIEFAEDGGYDRRDCWSDDGWAWLQQTARRAPRDVEQLRGGVLLQRQGELQRVPAGQPVLHCSRHEAAAWCRWAGRRLPTEPEWELAALTARSRGHVWGDVFEWVAGSARPWPGYAATPGSLDRMPAPGASGTMGVLRGASTATAPRWRHPKARRFMAPAADHAFCGFRSCAA
ncbi:MAG: SUMF1/EgtB/PvdO family nonheme iron enzyme [Proteobacteria bacterium]|nr:SUMF1/EgtB/PvdO family nonheme iron enzyme [Pseudomonadota bacterium]